MQLFMVYLGGRLSGCHIEMHDIRFVVGTCIEDTFGALKQQWVGDKDKVHMDSYVALRHIDGYQVDLVSEPPVQQPNLYFVNLGGYRHDSLAEQHEFGLFVAPTAQAAKARALNTLLPDTELRHKDDLYAVDDCMVLDLIDGKHYVQLTPSGQSQPIVPQWFGYHKL
ncbi:DUF1543 domain-containing protein [Pseudoalteromonas sp. McH1-42]|uniref:DUF1543 domain-containing protein n=1 Tax=Pseudoalteromonas sp. McH1-42 TaxID=2917752 RepID=UPI001EF62463|nr:DUF1543 domain-containing protein [Pseudoalteromonas sp. McH1-42]MCG7563828.1 DUF1543 domain-containing protein [Pseudoalteromonas sp. McH1-42]